MRTTTNYQPLKTGETYHLLDAAGMDELNYLKAVHRHLIMHLGGRYRNGAMAEVAHICDSEIDHSGRLLGEVRDYARS